MHEGALSNQVTQRSASTLATRSAEILVHRPSTALTTVQSKAQVALKLPTRRDCV